MSEHGSRPARGLLLDLDGTLADTLPALREVYAQYLREHRIADRAPAFERFDGLPLREIVSLLIRTTALASDPEEIERDYRARMLRACEAASPSRGAHDLVGKAQAMGFRVAVVTSGDRTPAQTWLERNDLSRFVDLVVGAGDVNQGKPSPDPYCRALEMLGLVAADSVAVEDSKLGARSAVAAGLRTYVLASPSVRREPGWPAGSRFVTDLDEVVATL